MARVLIVPCGCRGRELGGALLEAGHAVRGSTRSADHTGAIRDAGIEPYVGDPDRVATLMDALTGVSVVCWLAGTATGDGEKVAALHDGRLRMLLEKVVDTPVRGVIYEAAGPLDISWYARGAELVAEARKTWNVPIEVIDTDPYDHDAWLRDAAGAVERLLGAR